MKLVFTLILTTCIAALNTYANMNTKNNPLLSTFNTPFQTTPFDQIKPEHYEPAFKTKIAEANSEIKILLTNKKKPTFQNTIVPLEKESDDISRMASILFNLNSAETSPEIQAVTQKVSPMLTQFMGKINVNAKLFKRVEEVYNNRLLSGLTGEEIRLVETTYKSMKRNGANLNQAEKKQLIQIQMKLSKLNLKFNENVLAENNDFLLSITDNDDLAGLPESVIEAAALTAKAKKIEGWAFTLQFPSYSPFMKYSANRPLREKMYNAYNSRGNHGNLNDNNEIIREIVNLRLQIANLLGYESYSEYVLEERMAQTPEKVMKFLTDLHQVSKPYAQKEVNEVREFAKDNGLKDELMPWDFSYYSEKLKSKKFGFEEEMIKPYFKLENVIEGVFGLATKLYGITFKQENNIPVYHPDVKTYEVYDENGKFLSVFYADFHPREGKKNGAWMTEYCSQSNIEGRMVRPHISICGNFTKPTESKPSLLTFNEVETFLHEFGHALHGMFANTTYPSLSGTNVYRDFVELPSQIMENWAVEIDWLKTFAVHYQTGKPMPQDLIQKLIDSRNFQSGYQTERQLTFGFTDMAWHSVKNEFNGSTMDFEHEAINDTQLFTNTEGNSISTAFSHIFAGGYAAGYYGYKWAEVLDADAFSVFKTNGIFSKDVAAKFRKSILEKGGTANPMELYIQFKGEEPSNKALLERSGLN
jgi:peptidyl-dipeptidase Dcp